MTQPIAGYVLDVVGLKVGFALFALAWSIISMAHGLATNWQSFAVLRGMLGLAEGSANPAGMKATSEWFPAKERGLAGGFFNVGASVGSMLAPPLVVWAILHYGWRSAFVITGALGLVWAAFWYWFYEPPDRNPRLSEEEREYIAAGQEAHLRHAGSKPSVGQIAARAQLLGIAIPRFLADPTWGTLTFWVPLYLSSARGFDLKQIALFAWLPFLAADIGAMFGGVVAMALHRRGVSIIDARRWAFTLGARAHDAGRGRRLRAQPVRRDRADQPRRLRAPDAVRHGDHDGVRPVPPERGRDRGGDGGLLRQLRVARVQSSHRRTGRFRRLHALLRLSSACSTSSAPSCCGVSCASRRRNTHDGADPSTRFARSG